jgi:hypothetical protein
MGEMRNAYKIVVRKPEGKKIRKRVRLRLKDNFEVNFEEKCRTL